MMDLDPYRATHEIDRNAGSGGSPVQGDAPRLNRFARDDAARAVRAARHAQDLATVAQALVDLDEGRPVRPR